MSYSIHAHMRLDIHDHSPDTALLYIPNGWCAVKTIRLIAMTI